MNKCDKCGLTELQVKKYDTITMCGVCVKNQLKSLISEKNSLSKRYKMLQNEYDLLQNKIRNEK